MLGLLVINALLNKGTNMPKAYVEVRKQHSKGTWPKKGPDTYVAVQVVPNGETRLKVLNTVVAHKRNIRIIYCGEGYATRQKTNRSMLGYALEKAHKIAHNINTGKNEIGSDSSKKRIRKFLMRTVVVKAVNLKKGDVLDGQRIRVKLKYPTRKTQRTMDPLSKVSVCVLMRDKNGYNVVPRKFIGHQKVLVKRPKYNYNT